jgi:exodeoxyribonuclease VII small subunit
MSENEQTSLDFEAALEELEALVARMEEGDLPLEEALRQFERGIRLTRDCQRALREAEQKVDLLVEQAGDSETTPFDPES